MHKANLMLLALAMAVLAMVSGAQARSTRGLRVIGSLFGGGGFGKGSIFGGGSEGGEGEGFEGGEGGEGEGFEGGEGHGGEGFEGGEGGFQGGEGEGGDCGLLCQKLRLKKGLLFG